MHSTIYGQAMPVLEISLGLGERVVASTGELSWKSRHVEIKTMMGTGGAKGVFGALGRAVGGGGLFMTEYSAPTKPGVVAFAAHMPGNFVEENVRPGQDLIVHKHGFVCGTEGISLATEFQRSLGAGIFGGNGFIMQRVSGNGTAWFELGGEIRIYSLGPTDAIDVHPGHIGMYENSVGFDITMVPGIRNKIFGNDGLFLATLTGPGKVWLQTLPLPNFAASLAPYIGADKASVGVAGAIAGGLLKGISDI